MGENEKREKSNERKEFKCFWFVFWWFLLFFGFWMVVGKGGGNLERFFPLLFRPDTYTHIQRERERERETERNRERRTQKLLLNKLVRHAENSGKWFTLCVVDTYHCI